MELSSSRLRLPASLALGFVSAAALSGCPRTIPSTDAAGDDSANDSQPSNEDVVLTDAAAEAIVVSDACATTNCVNGPFPFCGDNDGSVLACPAGSCTGAFALDGALLGTQCYSECVTSTLADGGMVVGFC